MFENKLPELAKSRGVENAFQLCKAIKVSPTTANRIWKGDISKIGIDTLHAICQVFNCQISDFLHWKDTTKAKG